MSLQNKKTLFRGGAAIAGIAGIGLFVKSMLNKKDEENKTEQSKSGKTINRTSVPLPNGYLGVKIDLPDYYEKLLQQMPEPKLLYKHFMLCLSTPRPSAKLDKMRAALKNISELLNIEFTEDEIGNVCLKKAGSKGYEKAPGVIIQCHMDIVCTKTDDCKFDFDNDPIPAYLDGEWLTARNTTLGADDGIGVAAGLALMEHPNLVHGPIELLITVDEETSMGGAINLGKAPFLQNNMLINVDSEESNRICIGCAGGFNKTISVKMNRGVLNNDGYKVYNINITGLCGGHTGLQIQSGRANAIQLLCRVLSYLQLEKKIEIQLVDIAGGNAMNAIPKNANCNIVIPDKACDVFEEAVQEYWLNYVLPEFKDIESKMHMDSKVRTDLSFKNTKVCDIKSTQVLVSLMMNLPHGVLRMSPSVEGLVQTSVAFSQLEFKVDSDEVICGLFARSMAMNEMLEFNRKLDGLSLLFGNDITFSEAQKLFPGWDPVVSSPVLNCCKDAHVALYSEIADVYAVHAGLECGLIKAKYPQMDCVSIGPHIEGAHSTDEKLEVKTVPIFYDWLVETVTRIAMQK